MNLRDYQFDIFQRVSLGNSNDLVQLDTGAGKTPIIAALAEQAARVMIVAHRNVLISQASEKLAAFGLEHDTVSTEYTRRRCALSHRRHGRSFIVRGHRHRLVASIDSLMARRRRGLPNIDPTKPWLILIDEAHHAAGGNKWAQLRDLFPAARFVGFTATPCRLDGESLHIERGGLFDRLVQARQLADDGTGWLIRQGHLSGYVLYAPPNMLKADDRNDLAVGLDPLEAYRKYCRGMRCVVFMPAIRTAEEQAEAFRSTGISSASISSCNSAVEVSRIIDEFEAGNIQALFSVDMIGEGFDVPGIEAVMVARQTKSFARWRQWIGRGLRPSPRKAVAVVVDLCGNWVEHGLPDDPIQWNLLDPPKGRSAPRSSPCVGCNAVYLISLVACPKCGAPNELHHRGNIGGHYVRLVNRLDQGLLEQSRREADRRQYDEAMCSGIVWPDFPAPAGAIGRATGRLRRWMVSQLEAAHVGYGRVNAFLHSAEARQVTWWARHFTLADAAQDNPKKCLRVLELWEKSR